MGERKKSGIGKKLSMDATLPSAARLPLASNITVFILPGVDVKVSLYTSRKKQVTGSIPELMEQTASLGLFLFQDQRMSRN
jgi:hypothetical protein